MVATPYITTKHGLIRSRVGRGIGPSMDWVGLGQKITALLCVGLVWVKIQIMCKLVAIISAFYFYFTHSSHYVTR